MTGSSEFVRKMFSCQRRWFERRRQDYSYCIIILIYVSSGKRSVIFLCLFEEKIQQLIGILFWVIFGIPIAQRAKFPENFKKSRNLPQKIQKSKKSFNFYLTN